MNTTSKVNTVSDKVRIKVDRKVVDGHVHSSVWSTRPFAFDPVGFVPESKKLGGKIIEASVQGQSLRTFWRDPKTPMIYVVAGNPDDAKAKYFAAFLVSLHMAALGVRADVLWESVTGVWENQALRRDAPSMLVLSGLTDISSKVKLEKARDLIERWPTIPRIVVCAGEDPLSFAAMKLRTAAHGIAYFWSKTIKTVQEVY